MTDSQILALVSAILPFLIAFATYLGNALLAHLPKNRQAQLSALAQDAVHAAEQLGSGQSGQVKKQIATDLVTKIASDLGVHINQSLVPSLIEAAVYAMNSSKPAQPLPQVDLTKQAG